MTTPLIQLVSIYTPSLEAKHILLVDDDRELRELNEKLLKKVGCSTIVKGDGREALEYMLSPDGVKIDAIITDNNMPSMDGIVFLSKMIQERYGTTDSYIQSSLFTILNSGRKIQDKQFYDNFGRSKQEIPNLVMLSKPYSTETLYKTLSEGISARNTRLV